MLTGHGVIVRQGADLLKRRVLQVLRFIDNENHICTIQPLAQCHDLVHLVAAFWHPHGPGQQLDSPGQVSGTGGNADPYGAGSVVSQELLGSLALTHSGVTVQHHHAVL